MLNSLIMKYFLSIKNNIFWIRGKNAADILCKGFSCKFFWKFFVLCFFLGFQLWLFLRVLRLHNF